MKMGALLYGPRGTAASRRAIKARERGPGISVRILIVNISVPPNWSLVEVHKHLLGFEIFFQAPWAQLATKAGLLVPTPRRFDIRWLHVIHPNDPGAKGLDDAKGFVNVSRPNSGSQTVRRVVGNANRVRFSVERNHGRNRAEDLFTRDACAIFHIVENRGLEVIAFAKLLRPAAANRDLGFFLSDFEIGLHAIILFFADQRAHLGFAFERRPLFDSLFLLPL